MFTEKDLHGSFILTGIFHAFLAFIFTPLSKKFPISDKSERK